MGHKNSKSWTWTSFKKERTLRASIGWGSSVCPGWWQWELQEQPVLQKGDWLSCPRCILLSVTLKGFQGPLMPGLTLHVRWGLWRKCYPLTLVCYSLRCSAGMKWRHAQIGFQMFMMCFKCSYLTNKNILMLFGNGNRKIARWTLTLRKDEQVCVPRQVTVTFLWVRTSPPAPPSLLVRMTRHHPPGPPALHCLSSLLNNSSLSSNMLKKKKKVYCKVCK